jgi:hypothetical protein
MDHEFEFVAQAVYFLIVIEMALLLFCFSGHV